MQLSIIKKDSRYLISPQITVDDYPDDDIERNINQWYRTALVWAMVAQGTWQIRGGTATMDLEAGVMKYELPVLEMIRIMRVEVKYTNDGAYVIATPTDLFRERFPEANMTRVSDNASTPSVDLSGNNLIIRPAPTLNIPNGIQIWIQKNITELANEDDMPDLLEPIHRLLSFGAAYDYAVSNEMYRKAQELNRAIFGSRQRNGDFVDGIKQQIEDLYTMRTGTARPQLKVKRINYR